MEHVEQEHVKREKQIMAECESPFIVNLVASFKDAISLYMLQEAVMGGELFTYLQVESLFYSAQHKISPSQKFCLLRLSTWQEDMYFDLQREESPLTDTSGDDNLWQML